MRLVLACGWDLSAEDGLRARLAEAFTTRSVTGAGEAVIAD